MAGVAPVEGTAPQAGEHCPRCGDGILHLIADRPDGYELLCFNCDTRGSIPKDGTFIAAVDPDDASPTGFTITHAQLEARAEADKGRQVDVEQTVDRSDGAEHDDGSGQHG